MKILLIILIIAFLGQFCHAQDLPVIRSVERAYHKGTRNTKGTPGRLYWQNKANYDIKVNFNPTSRHLNGIVDINYTNNSPDTLKNLLFKLYPNLYKTDAIRNQYVAEKDMTTGVQVTSFTMDDHKSDSTNLLIQQTNMKVNVKPILPGQQVHITLSYNYILNKTSFIRTGEVDSGAFFIAYFFPRIAVYDDIDGWNKYPYAGKEEFYNDYGNFHAEITVPGNYQLWATGDLKNAKEVYKPEILQRMNRAENNDVITDVITSEDLKKRQVTQNNTTNTWKFEADHVIDFAFAMSNHYLWKSTSVMVDSVTKRRTRVDAVFNPDHETYLPVIGYARKTVELISHYFPKVPFPYSHETIFDGLDAMEYPMMVNNLPFPTQKETIQLTSHEIFHSLFPFYVGTNETKYSFMDEGWATMAEFYLYPKLDSADTVMSYDLSSFNNSAGTAEEVPVMTLTPQLYGRDARYTEKDLKPALAMTYLKEMLGDKLFLQAMHYYMDNWNGKHPIPYDFFYSMNTGSGVNLNWFWKNWFFETNVPDLAISKVIHQKLDYTITIASPGTLAVPIHLNIIYNDGSKQTINRNISCWIKGNKFVTLHLKARKPVKELVLGSPMDVDIHPENNRFSITH